VEPVLETAECARGLVRVEELGREGDRLEPRKGRRELAPQLSDLARVPQPRLSFRRHEPHLSDALRSSTIAAVNAAGASILVVEDDAALRFVCRVNLELDDFRVREAEGIDQARAAVAAERPALVFLDLHLGHGAADDLLDELRADGIPVVLVSGTVDVADYEGRATAVMPKPFDPADLLAAAHRHAAS